MNIFFFDLDNTLSDARERYQFAGPEPHRPGNEAAYDAWLEKVQDEQRLLADKPLLSMIEKARVLKEMGNEVVVLTAREEKFRGVSEFWLQRYGLDVPVLMRPNKNIQEAHVFKRAVLSAQQQKTPRATITMVDDDTSGSLSRECLDLGVRFFKVYFNSKGQVRCGLLSEQEAA